MKNLMLFKLSSLFLAMMEISSATLSPAGINYEVVALMTIKSYLNDPYNVLENWDSNSVDPCSWRMVTCSPDGYVSALGLPSQNLSGTLSPLIGNLSELQSVLLQNNDISGPIPPTIGKLEKLQTLDFSNNTFSGEIPTSFGDLKNLNYLWLKYSLTGPCPDSLSKLEVLLLCNPLICGPKTGNNCSAVFPEPLLLPPDGPKAQSDSGSKGHLVAVAFGASFGALFSSYCLSGFLFGGDIDTTSRFSLMYMVSFLKFPDLVYCCLETVIAATLSIRHLFLGALDDAMVFDRRQQYDPEVCLGHLKSYTFKELRVATDHFNSKNVLGRDQVETISLAVHRNLLRLSGFCTTENERLLVYPYAEWQYHIHGRPALDWARRKRIALGQSSEKTDVFGFGILLLELITGKKLHHEGKLSLLVDKDLKGNFDRIELEETIQIALLCTQFNPLHRPRMSEVLRMLEGDRLVDKWEASQTIETPRSRSCDNPPLQRYSDFLDESSFVVEAMELSGPR
ncbi:kelch repeat-containing F-box family protein [Hibiscus syriacus]|uniref:Kelch repeat-containing F-box family protein n=1 Tax=Hibiscus syriacus TaxID=106335 RepID=A0A6A3ALF0_HIBSY|nr:kelch repeat-containing F-box family protein [Hibiscus syriacus]